MSRPTHYGHRALPARGQESDSSAIFVGRTTHTRRNPSRNQFTYGVYMAFVNIDDLCAKCLDRWPLFSSRSRFALTSLLGHHHMIHEDPSRDLSTRVRDFVQRHSGKRPSGQIFLLTNLCVLGVEFNPVSFYYVYNDDGANVEFIVAEVANFPWLEQHSYLVTPEKSTSITTDPKKSQSDQLLPYAATEKQFHVSPFMPVDGLEYRWLISNPDECIRIRIAVQKESTPMFFATLDAKRHPWNTKNLLKMQFCFPWHSIAVMFSILYEAGRMFQRGYTFFSHPTGATSWLSCLIEYAIGLVFYVKSFLQAIGRRKHGHLTS